METTLQDELAKRGRAIYLHLFESLTEDAEDIGKLVAIDPATGDYEVDADLLLATERLKERHPNARLWGERIGYNAIYSLGGAIYRINETGERI
ncbi:MAG: hypothetical protein H8F28_11580 [Fibrella sp.]|nr:hypothetical protein [Armatimonadota bacterium]